MAAVRLPSEELARELIEAGATVEAKNEVTSGAGCHRRMLAALTLFS
jgi:hypothetical protein